MTNTVVHCTAKLGKLLGVKVVPLPDYTDTWNAHLFPYDGRNTIMNYKSDQKMRSYFFAGRSKDVVA